LVRTNKNAIKRVRFLERGIVYNNLMADGKRYLRKLTKLAKRSVVYRRRLSVAKKYYDTKK